jgi:hypothetical protein
MAHPYAKTECSWCGSPINPEHYEVKGNQCDDCSAMHTNLVGGLKGTRTTKWGKLKQYKIRDYTQEEKEEILIKKIQK